MFFAVFRSLANDRNTRIEGVSNLNWREYAMRHSIVWRRLVETGRGSDLQSLLFVPNEAGILKQNGHSVGGSR